MDPITTSIAYKYVALTLMLAEINYCSERLQLPIENSTTADSFRLVHVSNPYLTGFGGTLETDDFSFVFFKSGRLRRIVRINRFENIPLRELQWKQSRMKSLINTNEAYALATNWLSAISVDVAALERKCTCSVQQKFFYPDATSFDDPPEKRKRIVLLPVFQVRWGDPTRPSVIVSLFGPTKELLGINQNDESFSRRPKDLVLDMDSLLGIADAEFKSFSASKRRDLAVRFAAVKYPAGVFPNFDPEIARLLNFQPRVPASSNSWPDIGE